MTIRLEQVYPGIRTVTCLIQFIQMKMVAGLVYRGLIMVISSRGKY